MAVNDNISNVSVLESTGANDDRCSAVYGRRLWSMVIYHGQSASTHRTVESGVVSVTHHSYITHPLTTLHPTLMLALLDFTLISRQAL